MEENNRENKTENTGDEKRKYTPPKGEWRNIDGTWLFILDGEQVDHSGKVVDKLPSKPAIIDKKDHLEFLL
jgi:hypothetical protein